MMMKFIIKITQTPHIKSAFVVVVEFKSVLCGFRANPQQQTNNQNNNNKIGTNVGATHIFEFSLKG